MFLVERIEKEFRKGVRCKSLMIFIPVELTTSWIS